jgi:hypothetical protein
VSKAITFLASFPNIQTAIRVAGDGGARILLDIPEDELPAIARLLLMRGMVLKITVEINDNGETTDRNRYFES